MTVLPPGTILQLMYLRERLSKLRPGVFAEIGPGSGEITRLLLDMGWTGRSYDLEEKTIAALGVRFAPEIDAGHYAALNEDFLLSNSAEKSDLVISCMVMEHLEDQAQATYLEKAATVLKPGGVLISLVPASPAQWGIEDDIAGHCRRYTRESIQELVKRNRWSLEHLVGLTYPVSNFLLPLSNFLVRRGEQQKLELSPLERTRQSGRRRVVFKTHFPLFLGLLLNRFTLYPLHRLQKLMSGSTSALVLFFEAKPQSPSGQP